MFKKSLSGRDGNSSSGKSSKKKIFVGAFVFGGKPMCSNINLSSKMVFVCARNSATPNADTIAYWDGGSHKLGRHMAEWGGIVTIGGIKGKS